MVRLLQQFDGKSPSTDYLRSFQFKVADRIDEDLAIDMLLDWLGSSRILEESKHKVDRVLPTLDGGMTNVGTMEWLVSSIEASLRVIGDQP